MVSPSQNGPSGEPTPRPQEVHRPPVLPTNMAQSEAQDKAPTFFEMARGPLRPLTVPNRNTCGGARARENKRNQRNNVLLKAAKLLPRARAPRRVPPPPLSQEVWNAPLQSTG
uniref:Uncharacterized protein n=1 Tax=Eutreptiella gymnastica TaxID=73025 RepID=A0A7S4GHH1_9EUGL